jgi:predicted Zn-dependent peptidase
VLTESSGSGRSVTFGVAVPVGSRDEGEGSHGASHFLEHLLFKGTSRRSALEISASIESVGGELNAFTSKEYTCFYARVLDRDAHLAVDVLLDLVTSALLTDSDIESERDVVIEEIAMHDDDPSGVAHEVFAAQVFAGTALAASITGTQRDIADMETEAVRAHYQRWYALDNLTLVGAGRLDHHDILGAVEDSLSRVGHKRRRDPVPRRFAAPAPIGPAIEPGRWTTVRPTEQVNVVLGTGGVSRLDPRRYAASVFNAAIGSGMSSRLFQRVREERGLAYSVQSFTSMYSDAGAFGVYAGTSPARAEEALELIAQVLDEAQAEGFSDDEIERGKGQLRGGLVLGREESSSRMVALAESEVITGRLMSLSDSLALIDSVSASDVADMAQMLASGPRLVSTVGPEVASAKSAETSVGDSAEAPGVTPAKPMGES